MVRRLLAATIAMTALLGAAAASAALLVVDAGHLAVYTYSVHLEPTPEPPSGLDCRLLPLFRAQLEWSASPSPGVESYRIYHRGPLQETFSLLAEVPAASTNYDELRPSFLHHRYFVAALLGSRESGPSNTIEVHCRPRLFSLPGPCDLSAENHRSQRTIELAWAEVAGATEYAALRATTSGGPYDVVVTTAATTYTDAAVSEGVTYYYLVVALDAEGNESDPSPEVSVPDAPPDPAPTPPSPPPPAASPPAPPAVPTVEYTVRPGESLSDVAAFFGTTVEAVVALNGLTDPSLVVPGQRLLVPAPPANTAPGRAFLSEYVVQPGETLTDIAARFGTTVEALAAANNLANPSAIRIGDRLLVP